MNAHISDVPTRLAPTMASFRLLVFAFVRDYIALMGVSPSYGEISNKFDCGPTRAKRAVKSLVRDGLLLRTPGPRGLKLPSMREEAIRQLRDLGFVVDEDVLRVAVSGPKSTLLTTPALDYLPDRTEGMDGEQGEEPRARTG